MDRDVTAQVKTGEIDGELLPLQTCVCGATFTDWNAVLSIYRKTAFQCPHCKQLLYFEMRIRVYEVNNDKPHPH
jgi:hypothetical protein